MSSRQQRAAHRRAHWNAEVVTGHQPKGPRYDGFTGEERLAALWRLSVRAWRASGRTMAPSGPRSTWPGSAFERPRRG
jgi:hypothetical protein